MAIWRRGKGTVYAAGHTSPRCHAVRETLEGCGNSGSVRILSRRGLCLRQTFLVPETWRTQSAVLEFEAVYQNAQVFVNDALVAEQRYGYTNFFVVLDPQLKYGEENEIKVIADNSSGTQFPVGIPAAEFIAA